MRKRLAEVGDIWCYTYKKPSERTYHLLVDVISAESAKQLRIYDTKNWFVSLCLTDGDSDCIINLNEGNWKKVA